MPAGTIAPGQLTLLADELEALLRAGAPLGTGLRQASGRWRGPLRPAAERLAVRLDSGQPVTDALRSSDELPPLFRSIAAAGMASGRAADVLAAYASSTRTLIELRDRLLRGMLYPAVIVVMAYGLLVMAAAVLLPQLAAMVTDVAKEAPWWAAPVERLKETLPIWSWAVPVGVLGVWILLSLFGVWNRDGLGWFGSLPLVRGTLRDIHTATASRLLAALVSSQVPMPLALSLASETLATRSARQAVESIARQLENGVSLPSAVRDNASAPPLWRALLAKETEQEPIVTGLSHISEVLSERARNHADFVGSFLPLLILLVVGVTVVVGYALIVFGPLVNLWDRLGGAS